MTTSLEKWFEPEVEPTRAGLYERLYLGKSYPVRFCWWCPQIGWGMPARKYATAIKRRFDASSEQNVPWRALTANTAPKEVQP